MAVKFQVVFSAEHPMYWISLAMYRPYVAIFVVESPKIAILKLFCIKVDS